MNPNTAAESIAHQSSNSLNLAIDSAASFSDAPALAVREDDLTWMLQRAKDKGLEMFARPGPNVLNAAPEYHQGVLVDCKGFDAFVYMGKIYFSLMCSSEHFLVLNDWAKLHGLKYHRIGMLKKLFDERTLTAQKVRTWIDRKESVLAVDPIYVPSRLPKSKQNKTAKQVNRARQPKTAKSEKSLTQNSFKSELLKGDLIESKIKLLGFIASPRPQVLKLGPEPASPEELEKSIELALGQGFAVTLSEPKTGKPLVLKDSLGGKLFVTRNRLLTVLDLAQMFELDLITVRNWRDRKGEQEFEEYVCGVWVKNDEIDVFKQKGQYWLSLFHDKNSFLPLHQWCLVHGVTGYHHQTTLIGWVLKNERNQLSVSQYVANRLADYSADDYVLRTHKQGEVVKKGQYVHGGKIGPLSAWSLELDLPLFQLKSKIKGEYLNLDPASPRKSHLKRLGVYCGKDEGLRACMRKADSKIALLCKKCREHLMRKLKPLVVREDVEPYIFRALVNKQGHESYFLRTPDGIKSLVELANEFNKPYPTVVSYVSNRAKPTWEAFESSLRSPSDSRKIDGPARTLLQLKHEELESVLFSKGEPWPLEHFAHESLKGRIRICSKTGFIRDDDNKWKTLSTFILENQLSLTQNAIWRRIRSGVSFETLRFTPEELKRTVRRGKVDHALDLELPG